MTTNSSQTIQDILGVKFTWYDYSFFFLMLLLSAVIGIYYGFYKKQETVNDYLLGGKSLGVLPVALSLTANNISGIALLAIPSDIYIHGISYWFTYISIVFVIFATYKITVPVFSKLQTTSTFEYLKVRFDTKTRLLGSALYLIGSMLYLPVVIYVPALGLAQATGINLHLINVLVCLVCIFYTSVGGLKAVVYSDSLQAILIIGSLIAVFILGIGRCSGLGNVWNTSYNNDRLTLHLALDFTKRNGIWAVTIGQFITWFSYLGISQVYIQRCLSLPSDRKVIQVSIMFAAGIFITGSLCNFIGLIMFTEYSDCDPLKAGILQKQDQLLPYYIMDISRRLPGLAGLFIAGIFSAALSTISGVLNGLSCTIYEDFISRYLPKNTSERKISTILKFIVVVVGTTSTAMVFICDKFEGMLALSNSLGGVTSGSSLALFVSGMLIPAINANGAYYGCLISMMFMSVVVFGSQWYQNIGYSITSILPVSIDGCPHLNSSSISSNNHADILKNTASIDEVPYIFKIAFYWYCAIGFIISIAFGLVISKFTENKKPVNRDLVSPIIYGFLLKKNDEAMHVSERLVEYNSLKKPEHVQQAHGIKT